MNVVQFAPETLERRALLGALRALKKGDFRVRMPLDLSGLDGEIAQAFNDVVDMSESIATELERIGEQVGRAGQISQRMRVPAAVGSWANAVASVNTLLADLVRPTAAVAHVIESVANGNLSQRMLMEIEGVPLRGEFQRIARVVNTMVDQLNGFASEVSRVAREVGTEGKLGGQARVPGVAGTWKDLTDNVNAMAANLTGQVRNIAEVTTAVAKGDLSRKITVDVRGEILELKDTINTMVDQLNGFASEVTRVAREVGTDGKLGGQALVPGVAGTWKDLTDNVNAMAANLTGQVRNIAEVTTAVAKGDLSRKITVDVRGEILELKDTINTMVDQLNGFASEVSRVAREVGTEGKLGGQARVPGVAGTWKDLTDNVNQLAANLTTQVRAIAEVATAVTKGDLTRSIMVEAMGEVAALKDNINEMIRNLKDTTLKNTEQDWLKTNLAKLSRMLQGQSDLVAVSEMVLSELAPLIQAQQGVIYSVAKNGTEPHLEMRASYASRSNDLVATTLRLGEGLIGQCAIEKKRIVLEDVPQHYIRVSSAPDVATPLQVVILPVLFEGETKGVLELASLKRFDATYLSFLNQLAETIGIVFNTIEANMRTSDLLEKSQSLTKELQNQQEELKQSNDRLGQQADNLQKSETLLKMQQEELRQANEQLQQKAQLLSEQMRQVEFKNEEIELAKAALEEKAEQLAQSSRYKSEFLANMSHELRTPLNSLLILAKLLADNVGDNLTPKQIDYAQTIYAAGADLLSLISDILDLAKIESGTITLDVAPLRLADLGDYVERTFRPAARQKGLGFTISIDPALPAVINTDEKRLQQILKNLLSNACKFTDTGRVDLKITAAQSGWSAGASQLNFARDVIGFVVSDTGVGIPVDKQQVIFEAFQQADGTTSRQYGGTGLGLSISRELAQLFGGEITVTSTPGRGSTFVLYMPLAPSVAAEAGAPAPSERASRPTMLRPGTPQRLRGAEALLPRAREARDDRDRIEPDDSVVLIIEDNPGLAVALLDAAHAQGLKGVIAPSGDAGVSLASELRPDAIALDIHLRGTDGWDILSRLKREPVTSDIPVSLASLNGGADSCIHMGFVASAAVPDHGEILLAASNLLERDVESLLMLDPSPERRAALATHAHGNGLRIESIDNDSDIVGTLKDGKFDCVVVPSASEAGSRIDLLKRVVASEAVPEQPFVLCSISNGAEQTQPECGDIVIVRRCATRKALVEDVSLFLHEVVGRNGSAGGTFTAARDVRSTLENCKVLIVDDDVRNVFALTSALEQKGVTVLNADDGNEGIEILHSVPDIDMVLMDIMMPGLDGYATIRLIRNYPQFKSLPIIAVTAKAMKGDRAKCLDAGASDYISKPVDVDHLVTRLRAWNNR